MLAEENSTRQSEFNPFIPFDKSLGVWHAFALTTKREPSIFTAEKRFWLSDSRASQRGIT